MAPVEISQFFSAWLSLFHFIQTTLNASSINKIAQSRDKQSEAGEKGDLGPRLENSWQLQVKCYPHGELVLLEHRMLCNTDVLGHEMRAVQGLSPWVKGEEQPQHNFVSRHFSL